jgi:hypothetical protein
MKHFLSTEEAHRPLRISIYTDDRHLIVLNMALDLKVSPIPSHRDDQVLLRIVTLFKMHVLDQLSMSPLL